MKVDGDFDRLGFNPASLSNKIQMLGSIAVKAIQASIVDIENICQGDFWLWQVLFAMVKARRKGKMSELLEQIAYPLQVSDLQSKVRAHIFMCANQQCTIGISAPRMVGEAWICAVTDGWVECF